MYAFTISRPFTDGASAATDGDLRSSLLRGAGAIAGSLAITSLLAALLAR